VSPLKLITVFGEPTCARVELDEYGEEVINPIDVPGLAVYFGEYVKNPGTTKPEFENVYENWVAT
jgi:hypothetical protein